MHAFPHTYQVTATASTDGDVVLGGSGLANINSQPPTEFGGPGDRWSPESLLMAAVADCFTLSFRAIAGASKLSFTQLDVDVNGVLDKVERKMKFTEIVLKASLQVSESTDPAKAERLLEMAEQTCLVTNSLNVDCELQAEVTIA